MTLGSDAQPRWMDDAGSGVAIPACMASALRDPPTTAGDFTPTRFCPAASKAWFATHMLRFVSSDFPRHQFTRRFYNQLMHCFSFIAHYDLDGFWLEYFTNTRSKVEFLEQVASHGGYGSPDHTWCDVEQEVSRRVQQSGLLLFYIQRLAGERDADERAEFARLSARFGNPAPVVGLPKPVFVPTPMSPARSGRRPRGVAGTAQLALSLSPAGLQP